jgi:hypothetical protein
MWTAPSSQRPRVITRGAFLFSANVHALLRLFDHERAIRVPIAESTRFLLRGTDFSVRALCRDHSGESTEAGLQAAAFHTRDRRRRVYCPAGTSSAGNSLRALWFTASRHPGLFAPHCWRKRRPDGEHGRATMTSTPPSTRPATCRRALQVRGAARQVVAESATTAARSSGGETLSHRRGRP